MSKKLVIASIVALCMFLVATMSVLPAEVEDLSGDWTLTIKWVEPPTDPADFPMTITMNNPFLGTVASGDLSGPIVNLIVLVAWRWQGDVTVVYKGLAFGSFMFGRMSNDLGQSGIWMARKGPASVPGIGDASILVGVK